MSSDAICRDADDDDDDLYLDDDDEEEENVPSSDVPPTNVNLTTWMRFVCHSVWWQRGNYKWDSTSQS